MENIKFNSNKLNNSIKLSGIKLFLINKLISNNRFIIIFCNYIVKIKKYWKNGITSLMSIRKISGI